MHVWVAAMIQNVRLLDVVPQIYEKCPKSEWRSINCLADPRLSADVGGEGPIWRIVLTAIIFSALIRRDNHVEAIYHVIYRMFMEAALGQDLSKLIVYKVADDQVKTYASPDSTAALICHLLRGMIAFTTDSCVQGDWIQVRLPLNCWVRAEHVQIQHVQIQQQPLELLFHAHMILIMQTTRMQHTGVSPRHMCITSSRKLCEEIELTRLIPDDQKLQEAGHGTCRSHLGSFQAETHPREWWPPGYESWSYHTFVLFEDGSIADLTADQWDPSAPQLSWPADPSRYSCSTEKAEVSRTIRRRIGTDKWREMEAADDFVGVYRTQLKWKGVEKKLQSEGQTLQLRDEQQDA